MLGGIVGGLIGGIGSAIGGKAQANAIEKAQKMAIEEQRAAREQIRSDLSPWRDTGQNALMSVADLSGLNGAEAGQQAMQGFTTSPGYQFQMEQGLRAIGAGAAARGMLSSAATQKAEMGYAQGLASQDFNNYYNRLFQLAQGGQNAAAAQGAATANAANQIAQTTTSGATAQAGIIGGMTSGLGNAIGNGLNSYYYGQQMNALAPTQNWSNPNLQSSDMQYFQPSSVG